MSNFYRVSIIYFEEGCPPYADGISAAFTSYPAAKEIIDDCCKAEVKSLNAVSSGDENEFYEVDRTGEHVALIVRQAAGRTTAIAAYDIYEVEEKTCEFPWWKYRGYNISSDGLGERYVVERSDESVLTTTSNIEEAFRAIDKELLEKTN